MNPPGRSGLVRLNDARARITEIAEEHSIRILQRGTLDVRLAVAPPVPPIQLTAHAQDEVYIVIRGAGVLFHDGKRDGFQPGDLLFVSAGTEHRFEEYTHDLAVWIVFYGPQGGEVPV